jgi:hypothetical protein
MKNRPDHILSLSRKQQRIDHILYINQRQRKCSRSDYQPAARNANRARWRDFLGSGAEDLTWSQDHRRQPVSLHSFEDQLLGLEFRLRVESALIRVRFKRRGFRHGRARTVTGMIQHGQRAHINQPLYSMFETGGNYVLCPPHRAALETSPAAAHRSSNMIDKLYAAHRALHRLGIA